jgi:DNA modification methylase
MRHNIIKALEPLAVELSSITEDPRNARRHNPRNLTEIKKSLTTFGQRKPIVVQAGTRIVEAGNGLLQAAAAMGWTHVAAVFVEDDVTAATGYAIMDNRGAELSDWDAPTLKDLLMEMDDGATDLTQTGFTLEEIEGLLTEEYKPRTGKTDEDIIPAHVNTIAKQGQLWRLGEHHLLCGDSLDTRNLTRVLGGEMAEALFTDPPYNMDYQGATTGDGSKAKRHADIINDKMSPEEYQQFLATMTAQIAQHVRGAYYICCHRLQPDNLMNALTASGLDWRAQIVWYKNHINLSNSDYKSAYEPVVYGWVTDHNFYGAKGQADVLEVSRGPDLQPTIRTSGGTLFLKIGEHYYKMERIGRPRVYLEVEDRATLAFFNNGSTDVWEIARTKKNDLHPTMKPIELIEQALKNSTLPGDLVLDMFAGAGSTLIACEKHNRRCATVEMDPHYCDVTIQRWQDFTGQKAQLVEDPAENTEISDGATKKQPRRRSGKQEEKNG